LPDVKFILDADDARAVRGFLKVRDAAKKAGKSVKVITRNIDKMNKKGRQTGRAGGIAKAFAGGFGIGTGAGAVRAGVSAIQAMVRSSKEITENIGRQSANFDRMIRPTAALGDNAKNIAKIRNEILSTSVGFGIGAQETADGLFMLDSALGGFDEKVKSAIKDQALLTAALGGDFNVAVSAGSSLWLIYGDQLKAAGIEADDMMGKLAKVADLAKATPEQIGKFGLRVFAAGKARGFEFEKVGAAIPFATGISGSAQVATRNLANMITRLGKAEEELGITLKGGLLEQMEQVRDAVADDIKLTARIFDQALSGFAQQVLGNVKGLRRALGEIELADKTEQIEKLTKIRTDPTSRTAEIIRSGERALENIGTLRGVQDPKSLQRALDFKILKIGTKILTSPLVELTKETIQDIQQIVTLGEVDRNSKEFRAGRDLLVRSQRQAKNFGLAGLTQIETGGDIPGLFQKTAKPRELGNLFDPGTRIAPVKFPKRAAQLFADAQAADTEFTFEQFVENIKKDPVFRKGLLGEGTGLGPFVGDFLPDQPSRLGISRKREQLPQTPRDARLAAREQGKAVGAAVKKFNPNQGVEP